MKQGLLVVVSILVVVLASAPVFAAGKKKKASPTPKYQPPVITGVSGSTVTVTQEKLPRAFMITRFSEVTVNGQ